MIRLLRAVRTSDHAQIASVSVPLSRRATFGPSVRPDELPDLHRLTTSYPTISLEATLITPGIDPSPFSRRPGFSTPVTVADDQMLRDFLADHEIRYAILSQLEVRRAHLRSWGSEHLRPSDGNIHCVDIGWRGTIQDNLARVFDDFRWHGNYLGLFPLRDEQPANVSKTAAAFDANLGDEYSFADPPAAIERPWTPDVPSIVDVQVVGSGFRLVEDARDQGAGLLVKCFQEHAADAATLFSHRVEGLGMSPAAWRHVLGQRLRDYYQRPVAGIADIWFESLHDDTFGALGATPYAKHRPTAAWADDYPASLERAARESHWPKGYLTWLPILALTEAWQ